METAQVRYPRRDSIWANPCGVEGCKKKDSIYNYCGKHRCKGGILGCSQLAVKKKYCKEHYYFKYNNFNPCKAPGCKGKDSLYSYCDKHRCKGGMLGCSRLAVKKRYCKEHYHFKYG